MTTSYPKTDGDIHYADEQNDFTQRTTVLQGINASTKVVTLLSGTDITYTYANSDRYTDSNGYNNTLNATLSTVLEPSANNILDPNKGASCYYDTGVVDNAGTTVDDGWTDEANAFDEDDGTYATLPSLAGSDKDIGKTFTEKFVSAIKVRGYTANGASFSFMVKEGTTWTKITGNFSPSTATDYIVPIGRLITGFQVRGNSTFSNSLAYVYTIDFYPGVDVSKNLVVTTSRTFDAPVTAVMATANYDTSGTIDVYWNISTDSGTTYDSSNNTLNTIVASATAGSEVVIQYVLSGIGSYSPIMRGYAYQVFQ